MRIMILTQYYPPEIGAPQTRLAAVAAALKNAGHSVEVVTSMPNYPQGRIFDGYRGKLFKVESLDGIPAYRVWSYAAMGTGMARLANYASFALASVFGVMRAAKPDLVFVESPPLSTALPGALAAAFRNCRMVLNVADPWPDSVSELGVLSEGWMLQAARGLERWAYRRSDFITCVTETWTEDLRRKGVDDRKLLLLPNGVDVDMFCPRPPDRSLLQDMGLRIPADRYVIAFAGTLGEAQGLDTALRAMALAGERGIPAHLLLVGDGSDKQRLQVLAGEMGLDNVSFHPPMALRAVADLWAAVDAGFASLRDLPLFDGARPSKIFPMMASGKPIIYGGSGEASRLIREADAGVVVPPADTEALAEAIQRLAASPEEGERLGSNGRAYAVANLRWDRLVDAWLRQLRERGVS